MRLCLCPNQSLVLVVVHCLTALSRERGHAGQEGACVSNRRLKVERVMRSGGYLLRSREGMVETGHISHNGFLIWTSSVHNVYDVEEEGKTTVMKTNMYRHDRGHVIIHNRTNM